MLQRAKSILYTNQFTALYDKGYHTGSEFKIAHDLNIDTIVAIPGLASQAPNPAYNVENFTYNPEGDYYICPQNQYLSTTGKRHKAATYYFKRYTTKACKSCAVKDLCTKATYGKGIQRSEFQEYIQHNKEQVDQNQAHYKRRQAIVEHPYGTIKRQWGFSYIMTKRGVKRASADVGFMMTAYNLRRIINILGTDRFKKYLENQLSMFLIKTGVLEQELAYMRVLLFRREIWEAYFMLPFKRLYLSQISTTNGGF